MYTVTVSLFFSPSLLSRFLSCSPFVRHTKALLSDEMKSMNSILLRDQEEMKSVIDRLTQTVSNTLSPRLNLSLVLSYCLTAAVSLASVLREFLYQLVLTRSG